MRTLVAVDSSSELKSAPRPGWRGTAVLVARTVILLASLTETAFSQSLMPDFASAPTGWVVDRYAPSSFGNVGSYQGRDNVLGISISTDQNASNRGAQSGMFYNTQGMQYAVTGGAGSSLSADLFVGSGWSNNANGAVRTDIWGVMGDTPSGVTDYPIIGFTNAGGVARFRVYDGDLATNGGWVDLSSPVTEGSWTSLKMTYNGGSSLSYYINGGLVYTDTTIGNGNPSQSFSGVIMQAYNFGDPTNFPTENAANYTAHWANVAAVPEPETYAMLLGGLGVLGYVNRRRKQKESVAV